MEFKVNGFIPSPVDPRDFRLAYGAVDYDNLPEEWQPDMHSFQIHNQGAINSCVGHALTGQYEIHGTPNMAYGYIYGDRRYTDHAGEGMITRDAIKTLQKDGVPTLKSYPFDAEVQEIIDIFNQHADSVSAEASKYKIKNYYRLYSVNECKKSMMEGKAVVYGLYLFEGMIDNKAGTNPMVIPPAIKNSTMPNVIGGHLVGACGWTKKGMKFPNSWSEKWGDKGFGYIDPKCFTWSQENNFPIPLVEMWAFEFEDGTEPVKPVAGWYKDGDKWRFSENGADKTGWLLYNGTWYYLDSNGWMVTGWRLINNHWYYFWTWGGMAKGFVQIGKEVFYLNEKLSNEGGRYIPEGSCIITDNRGNIV